jgi:hypothetical protein
MTAPRNRAPRKAVAVPAPENPFQRWAVSQALDKLVGGMIPNTVGLDPDHPDYYDPDPPRYEPSNPLHAQIVLLNSAMQAALEAEHRGHRLDRRAVLRAYIRCLNSMGAQIAAPFADRLGRALLRQGQRHVEERIYYRRAGR